MSGLLEFETNRQHQGCFVFSVSASHAVGRRFASGPPAHSDAVTEQRGLTATVRIRVRHRFKLYPLYKSRGFGLRE